MERRTLGEAEFRVGGRADPPRQPVRIRGRSHLLGADSPGVPETLAPAPEGFPLVARVAPGCDGVGLDAWARAARRLLDERLGAAGAVLFRGLPLRTVEEFSRFFVGLGLEPMAYGRGLATRRVVAPHVMTTNAASPETTIMMHTELSYASLVPRHLIFFCEAPPVEGGETPIARCTDWRAELGDDFIRRLDARGLRRHVRYADGTARVGDARAPSWQQAFQCETREEVERACRVAGIEYAWGEDGALDTRSVQPVTTQVDGKRSWFCSPQMNRPATALDFRYADGSPLEDRVVEQLRVAQWRVAVAFAWQPSDVLCVDNLTCQHGRMSYPPGCDRRIFVSMATPSVPVAAEDASTASRDAP